MINSEDIEDQIVEISIAYGDHEMSRKEAIEELMKLGFCYEDAEKELM